MSSPADLFDDEVPPPLSEDSYQRILRRSSTLRRRKVIWQVAATACFVSVVGAAALVVGFSTQDEQPVASTTDTTTEMVLVTPPGALTTGVRCLGGSYVVEISFENTSSAPYTFSLLRIEGAVAMDVPLSTGLTIGPGETGSAAVSIPGTTIGRITLSSRALSGGGGSGQLADLTGACQEAGVDPGVPREAIMKRAFEPNERYAEMIAQSKATMGLEIGDPCPPNDGSPRDETLFFGAVAGESDSGACVIVGWWPMNNPTNGESGPGILDGTYDDSGRMMPDQPNIFSVPSAGSTPG